MHFRFPLFLLLVLSFSFSNLKAHNDVEPNPVRFSFTENIGQVKDSEGKPRPEILFTAEADGIKLFFQKDKVSYVYSRKKEGEEDAIELYRLDYCFSADKNLHVMGFRKESTQQFFYLPGVGKEKGFSADEYSEILYENVQPGIDLRFYWKNGGLKYDWILEKPEYSLDIRFWYEGETSVEFMAEGSMLVSHPMGTLLEGAPISFRNGKEISTQFRLMASGCNPDRAGDLGFDLGPCLGNGEGPVTIDPTVAWSTYFGGSGTENSRLYSDIASDPQGNVYFTGHSASTNFPTSPGAFQTVYGGPINDAFIVKMDSTGQRIWATYIGGSQFDVGNGIGVDALGNVFITGISSSTNFPTTPGSYRTTLVGVQDAFVAKFSPTGARLWATYFGGTDIDESYRLEITSTGDVAIAGATFSSNFPTTTGAYQTTSHGGYDAFFARFSTTGSLSWSTLLGGSTDDYCYGFSFDAAGNILFSGQSNSTNLPVTLGAFQGTLSGLNDGIAGKFLANGTLAWLTYFGGTNNDDFTCATVDAAGNLYAGGKTFSTNYPVSTGAFQTTYTAVTHAGAIAKFSANGARLWSTYFSGGTLERFLDMEMAANGLLACTGETRGGATFPVTVDALYPSMQGGVFDAFFTKFTPGGSIFYSTFYGSAEAEYGRGLAAGQNGDFYLLGATESSTHPVTPGAFQSAFGGGTMDAFVTRFRDCPFIDPNLNQADTAYVCAGSTVTIMSQSSFPTYLWSTGGSGNSITVNNPGMYSITVTHASGCKGWDSVYVLQRPVPTAAITPIGPLTLCDNTDTTLTATTGDQYRWYRNGVQIPGASAITFGASMAGNYTVVVSNFGGCQDSTLSPVVVSTLPAPVVNLGADDVLCMGNSMTLDAGSGFSSYSWCGGLGSLQTIVITGPGTYCASVSSANGCTDSDTILITVSTAFADFSWSYGASTQILQFADQSSGAVSWSWDFGDGGVSNLQGPTHTYAITDTQVIVCLTIVDTNGCDSTRCETIGLGALGISDLQSELWQVFPNPFNSNLMINGIEQGCELQLTDVKGRLLVSRSIPASTEAIELDLAFLPAAVYFLRIKTDRNVRLIKLMKQD